MFDPYLHLGLTRDAPHGVIKSAFRRLARLTHPDIDSTTGAAARFSQVVVAWNMLASAEARALTDAKLERERVDVPAPRSAAPPAPRRRRGRAKPSPRPAPHLMEGTGTCPKCKTLQRFEFSSAVRSFRARCGRCGFGFLGNVARG